MKPSTFLQGLWGREIDPRLRIQIWRLADKRSWLIQAADAADYYADGNTDIYTSVCLTHPGAKGGRPLASESRAIAGLWLDIDVDGGPENKKGGVPDLAAAWRLANAIVHPTVCVHSGYGLHAWYLFDQPWLFYRVEDQQAAALASAQWYHLHRTVAAREGWGLDGTHDLARLLRLPGTFNGKGGAKVPVTIGEARGSRLDRVHLFDMAAEAGPVLSSPVENGPGVGDTTVTAGGRLEQAQLDALLDDPEIAAIFHHADGNGERWSLSEYDMSLATRLARAGGWTNDQIAGVLTAHRARHGETKKARRVKYLEKTIGNARANARRTDAAAQLSMLAREVA